MDNCALCSSKKELEISHILPKFLFRYQKKSSPTGNIRTVNNPNRIVQDGLKLPFLCGECEDIFSKWETSFANKIFYPYESGKVSNFIYDESLSKFLASLSYRCLKLSQKENQLDHIEPKLTKYVELALDNLQSYLLGRHEHPKEQRQHLVLLGPTTFPGGYIKGVKESDFNIYTTRAIEYDVISTDNEAFVYIKFLKFLVLCPIKIISNKGWRSSRISHSGGSIEPKLYELNDYVLDRILSGARLLPDNRGLLSSKQRDLIEKNLSKQDPDKLINSPLGKVMINNKN
ncbi:hypothetical protein [Aliivibrio fischeri]|uniref:hypothetical protein n=1 Tax=Aliivibrio fischeri TaxID=668 RepID=UPI00080E616B|nr:hypothetical protein [Aliivibrio fischeri]OCH02714.1 hypothetical protein A6E09_18515 [Aliivibrio fischeri]